MFTDDAFPDITSIKDIKPVEELDMGGWNLKEKRL